MRLTLGLLLIVGVSAVCVAQEPLDVAGVLGKTRLEAAAVFPGTAPMLRNWNGWRAVYLTPDAAGRVVSIVLRPGRALTEDAAEAALQRFGVAVDPAKRFASQNEYGYSDMDGPVRTVIYTLDQEGRVERIGIFSRLADAS